MADICPYCRCPIEGKEIPECPSCHVPHHLECWLENKGCSIPGCAQAPDDESKIVVPGQSVQPPPIPVRAVVPPPVAQLAPSVDQLASQGQRFANLILDYLFLFIFSIIFGVVLALAGLGEMLQSANEYLLWLIISCLYYIPQEAHSGRTLGKLITGTKAVSEDGSELTFGQVVGRTLCRFIPFEAFSFFGGNGRPRGWHDTIPKTKVVSVRGR